MLKVKSVKTIGFIGEAKDVVTQLTCPSCTTKHCYFYFKSNVYRIVSPAVSNIKVVVFSATDMLWRLDDLLNLSSLENTIIYITDYHKLRKLGVRINKQMLAYLLSCPVVFSTRGSARGLNRLLSNIDMLANIPSEIKLSSIKKLIFRFKPKFYHNY